MPSARARRKSPRSSPASTDALIDELILLEDELLSYSLADFTREAWHLVEPGQPYVHGWHIDAIATHLEAVTTGQIQRLLITMPPRHMKSLEVSVFWPAWVWTRRPSWRAVFTSYALGLAIRDSVKCRQVIASTWYRARWGHVFQLTGDQNEKSRFANNQKGERMTGSVDAGVTGEGGDVVVCDDPHNVREAHSSAARTAVNDWWTQVIPTRLNNPATGGRVIVMQRVHEDDVAAHWLEAGHVEHLCLPAEFETARRCRTSLGWADPRTTEGELLWPERFPCEALEGLKKDLGPYGTAGQLQQRPAPAEGGLIKRAFWQYYEPTYKPPLSTIVISFDPATKEKQTNDEWALGVWGKGSAAAIYGLAGDTGHWDLPEAIRRILALRAWCLELWPGLMPTVLVENSAAGPDAIKALKAKVPGVMKEVAEGDKVQRVHAVLPVLAAGDVYLPGAALPDGRFNTGFPWPKDAPISTAWVEKFIEECAAFPNTATDNQVDQMSQALKRLHAPRLGVATANIPGL